MTLFVDPLDRGPLWDTDPHGQRYPQQPSSGSSDQVGEGLRNMKSMWPGRVGAGKHEIYVAR